MKERNDGYTYLSLTLDSCEGQRLLIEMCMIK